ncbi:MAG: hypothetical protein ACLTTP_04150 [Alistipes ihumii]
MKVNLSIRDGEGNLSTRSTSMLDRARDDDPRRVPTCDYAPGIGINPGFDGEIDIVIPD